MTHVRHRARDVATTAIRRHKNPPTEYEKRPLGVARRQNSQSIDCGKDRDKILEVLSNKPVISTCREKAQYLEYDKLQGQSQDHQSKQIKQSEARKPPAKMRQGKGKA